MNVGRKKSRRARGERPSTAPAGEDKTADLDPLLLEYLAAQKAWTKVFKTPGSHDDEHQRFKAAVKEVEAAGLSLRSVSKCLSR